MAQTTSRTCPACGHKMGITHSQYTHCPANTKQPSVIETSNETHNKPYTEISSTQKTAIAQAMDKFNQFVQEKIAQTPTSEPINYAGWDLSGEHLDNNDFTMGNISSATLSNASLKNVNLHRAMMVSTNLDEADISEANLSEAIAHKASLSYANLQGANLAGADFSQANLQGANMRGTDMSGTDFRFADLRGADFSHAKIDKTNDSLDLAELDGATGLPKGFFPNHSLWTVDVNGYVARK